MPNRLSFMLLALSVCFHKFSESTELVSMLRADKDDCYCTQKGTAFIPCTFPFTYNEVTYNQCTTINSPNKPWCSYNAEHLYNQWNYCHKCPGVKQECSHNPCQNKGLCIGYRNCIVNYRCVCPDGYTGRDCESSRNVICEKSKKTVQCPTGQVIKVTSALYGRKDEQICRGSGVMLRNCEAGFLRCFGANIFTKCEAKNALSIIETKCNGYNSCEIDASNSVFGDPCSGIFKYVEMQHTCVAKEVKAIID